MRKWSVIVVKNSDIGFLKKNLEAYLCEIEEGGKTVFQILRVDDGFAVVCFDTSEETSEQAQAFYENIVRPRILTDIGTGLLPGGSG